MGHPSLAKFFNRLFGAALCLLAHCSAAAEGELTIEVFATTDRPVAIGSQPRIAVKTVDVDGVERFDAALSRDLTRDHATAQAEVGSRLASVSKADFNNVRRAAIGLADASQLGVDRIPAVVFNRSAVVYGVTNLNEALDRYQAWAAESD